MKLDDGENKNCAIGGNIKAEQKLQLTGTSIKNKVDVEVFQQ